MTTEESLTRCQERNTNLVTENRMLKDRIITEFHEKGSATRKGKEDYSKLPPAKATLQKWSDGQLVHGREFVGDPLSHLYEEQIDSFNYIAELENQGFDSTLVGEWRSTVQRLLWEVWRALSNRRLFEFEEEPDESAPFATIGTIRYRDDFVYDGDTEENAANIPEDPYF